LTISTKKFSATARSCQEREPPTCPLPLPGR
jgi:hypothetical protein